MSINYIINEYMEKYPEDDQIEFIPVDENTKLSDRLIEWDCVYFNEYGETLLENYYVLPEGLRRKVSLYAILKIIKEHGMDPVAISKCVNDLEINSTKNSH